MRLCFSGRIRSKPDGPWSNRSRKHGPPRRRRIFQIIKPVNGDQKTRMNCWPQSVGLGKRRATCAGPRRARESSIDSSLKSDGGIRHRLKSMLRPLRDFWFFRYALRRSWRRQWLIPSGPMSATPTWLLIKPLLLPADAIPAHIVQPVIVADRFDHVRCLSIAAFAAMNFIVFSGNHVRGKSYHDWSATVPVALLTLTARRLRFSPMLPIIHDKTVRHLPRAPLR